MCSCLHHTLMKKLWISGMILNLSVCACSCRTAGLHLWDWSVEDELMRWACLSSVIKIKHFRVSDKVQTLTFTSSLKSSRKETWLLENSLLNSSWMFNACTFVMVRSFFYASLSSLRSSQSIQIKDIYVAKCAYMCNVKQNHSEWEV